MRERMRIWVSVCVAHLCDRDGPLVRRQVSLRNDDAAIRAHGGAEVTRQGYERLIGTDALV